MGLYRKDKDGNLLLIANNFVQKRGKTALETKFSPKVSNTPDYYIDNDFIFNYDRFNREPIEGDSFISTYECTSNRLSYLCTWSVVKVDGSAKCRIEQFVVTKGDKGDKGDLGSEDKLDKKNPIIQKSDGTPHVYFFDNDVVYECILTVKNALNVDGLIFAGGNELRFNDHLSITDNLPAHNEIVKFTPDFVDFNKVITLKAGANVDIVGANNSAVVNKKYLYDNLSTVISEDMVNSLF